MGTATTLAPPWFALFAILIAFATLRVADGASGPTAPTHTDTRSGPTNVRASGAQPAPRAVPLAQAPPGQARGRELATAATAVIGADRWQEAGFSGRGVRIGILDAGFDGYESALARSLPANVVVRSFRADRSIGGGTDHGLRAAEIIHAIAPRAELYLVNFASVSELERAVTYLVDEEVDIVSFSIGYIHDGPGDGTGPVNEIVSVGAERDQLWAVAAGNWGEQHWSGVYADLDADSFHDFAAGSSRLGHDFDAGDLITVSLRWEDDWGAACSDYDLELFGPDGALVRASRGLQNCTGDPVERLQVLATQTGRYTARISAASANTPKRLSLIFVGAPDRGAPLDSAVASGSLAQPADHSLVLSVGAAADGTLASGRSATFSSRGPTTDGRSKPDVLAPTGLVGSSPSGFGGTSAAAPHAAGAAALLKEALPHLVGPALANELLSRADPAGAAGDTEPPGLSLGGLDGLGPLRPVGSEEASLVGVLPEGAGLAVTIYRGPDGYPPRFLHLLTPPGREPIALFRPDGTGGFERFISGAPALVQTLERANDGDVLLLRLGAP